MNRPGRRSVWSWVIYDLANTIFALGVVGLYVPDWLGVVDRPDSHLAAVQVAAAIVVVFLAPWVGARTDATGVRLPALRATTLVAVAATFFLDTGPEPLTLVLLFVAIVGVNTGSVVYDALIVEVSTPHNRGWVSGLGVGMGYVGSFIGLGIGLIAFEVLDWGFAGTFRTLAIAFLVFAIPAFAFIVERPHPGPAAPPGLMEVMRRVVDSWKTARRYEGVTRFLVGRFLYTDAINTLLAGFLARYVMEELGMTSVDVSLLLATAIAAAIAGGLVAARLLDRVSPIRLLRVVLVIWVVGLAAVVIAGVSGVRSLAWALGPVGGIALGATWSADRVVMTRISPPRHLGEFYGLYATVGRFATILGPLLWALVVDVAGWGRSAAMGVLGLLVAVSWLVLRPVDDSPRTWTPEDELPVRDSPGGSRT
ncbi:MAG TPA: MFS transporter [Acidimicrobiia bacterium]